MTRPEAGFGKCGAFFWLAGGRGALQTAGMKCFLASIFLGLMTAISAVGSTIMVVPVYEPLSLHGTDGDDALIEVGEALQATVMARPMALTGAFPEVLVDAIRSPHQIPTNNPNYQVKESNLLVLCEVGINGRMTQEGLVVTFDISKLSIPADVDVTSRQVLKLALIALRKTLDGYQGPQTQPLHVSIVIEGADDAKASLKELEGKFTMEPAVD